MRAHSSLPSSWRNSTLRASPMWVAVSFAPRSSHYGLEKRLAEGT